MVIDTKGIGGLIGLAIGTTITVGVAKKVNRDLLGNKPKKIKLPKYKLPKGMRF